MIGKKWGKFLATVRQEPLPGLYYEIMLQALVSVNEPFSVLLAGVADNILVPFSFCRSSVVRYGV